MMKQISTVDNMLCLVQHFVRSNYICCVSGLEVIHGLRKLKTVYAWLARVLGPLM